MFFHDICSRAFICLFTSRGWVLIPIFFYLQSCSSFDKNRKKKSCNCFMKPQEKRERMCHTTLQFHLISSGRVIPRSGYTSDSNQIRSLVQGLVLIHPIKWNLQFGCLANQTKKNLSFNQPKIWNWPTLVCILVWLPFFLTIYCNEVFHIANSSFMNLGVMQPSHLTSAYLAKEVILSHYWSICMLPNF
jgi:hypothetical protein